MDVNEAENYQKGLWKFFALLFIKIQNNKNLATYQDFSQAFENYRLIKSTNALRGATGYDERRLIDTMSKTSRYYKAKSKRKNYESQIDFIKIIRRFNNSIYQNLQKLYANAVTQKKINSELRKKVRDLKFYLAHLECASNSQDGK